MKKQLLLALCLLFVLDTNAQSFSKLSKRNGENPFTEDIFKLYARLTSVTSTYTPNYSGFTFNIAIARNEYDKWGTRLRYENPTLGDFISRIPAAVREVKAVVNDKPYSNGARDKWYDHAHGGGLFGWMQYYTNAVAKDRVLISPGLSFGDYLYGSRYIGNGSTDKRDQGPYGYYVVVGPAVMGSYLINKKMWIDAYVNYDISVLKVKNSEYPADYPKPHFLTLGADLYTTKKLFGGIRLNKVVDRGNHNDASSRLDISAGLLF